MVWLFQFLFMIPKEQIGEAAKWWLHQSIKTMERTLSHLNSYLVLRKGIWVDEILKLAQSLKVDAVYWNECFDPKSIASDEKLINELNESNILGRKFKGNVLHHPLDIKTKSGSPFKVYSAFWKALIEQPVQTPYPVIKKVASPPSPVTLTDLNLLPKKNWYEKFHTYWKVGEDHAQRLLGEFLEDKLVSYSLGRDFPSKKNISQLSPYLVSGQISSRFIFYSIKNYQPDIDDSTETFLREIVWREFSHYLLFNYPELVNEPLNKRFLNFTWDWDEEKFHLWTKGLTGYPLVDAGMRELWETGYMHNRVRMVVASFLTKHLLIPWQKGAEWFENTLLDADIANNRCNWQWVAGTGVDAQPYFRIFNPTMQGKKFDESGEYIRKWVPELKALPNNYIHNPSDAPEEVLKSANIQLGRNYPHPIVEHKFARERALERYGEIK